MAPTLNQMREDFHNTLLENPMTIRLQYFDRTFSGADYDNAFRTQSGSDIWATGMYFPVGMREANYLAQGRTILGDSQLFLHGSVVVNEDLKIALGSPIGAGSIYSVNEKGILDWGGPDGTVYNQIFIRNLNGGSFYNEY